MSRPAGRSTPQPLGDPSQVAQQARTRLLAARVLAQGRWPYASTLLFTLRLVEASHQQVSTMAVDDGWRLYYSPRFVLTCTPAQLATIVLHECQHLMLQHGPRFSALTQPAHRHPLWNLAGDAVINATLDEARMPWPTDRGVRIADLARHGAVAAMATEGVYWTLVRSLSANPSSALGDRQAGAGASLEGLALSDCGSGAGGPRRVYEIDRGDDHHPAVPRAQQDLVRDRVAQEALARVRSHGDVPGGLVRWAEDLLHPVIDWRTLLAGQMRSGIAAVAGRHDYSYRHPSRRAHALRDHLGGAVLPAMRKPPPPRVCVVIDTSGSITPPELRRLLAETLGIVRAVGLAAGVTVIPCDAQAYEPSQIRSAADIPRLPLPGGGGTDMGEGIAAGLRLRPRPDLIVVLTDGWTDWPDHPPRGIPKVIAGITDTQAPIPPEWVDRVPVSS